MGLFDFYNNIGAHDKDLWIDENGLVNGYVWDTGMATAAGNTAVSTTSINDGEWHHITLSTNGTNTTLYIDGNVEGVVNVPLSDYDWANTFRIGGVTGGFSENTFDGEMRDFQFYTDLGADATQVQTIMDGGTVGQPTIHLEFNEGNEFENTGSNNSTITPQGSVGVEQQITSGMADVNDNAAITLNVLANDTDVEDGQMTNIQSVGDITDDDGNVVGTLAIVTIDGVDQVEFTPSANTASMNPGEELFAAFEYTLIDSDGAVSTATAAINIIGTNAGPVVSDDIDHSIAEDNSITLTQADLLANASDSDGDTLTANNLQLVGSDATLVDNLDGTFTITPSANFFGEIAFTFDVSDGTDTVQAGGDLTVTSVNDAPTLTLNQTQWDENELETGENVIEGDFYLKHASDVEDDDSTLEVGTVNGSAANVGTAIAVTLTYNDANGVEQTQDVDFTIRADGTYQLHAFDFNALPEGEDAIGSISYQTIDSDGALSNEVTTQITITGTNDAPEITANTIATTNEDTAIILTQDDLLANASDVDTDAADLTATNVQATANATVVDNFDGTFTVTPEANFSGDIDLTFEVTDGTDTVASAIDLTVSAVTDDAVITLNNSVALDQELVVNGNIADGATDWTLTGETQVMNEGIRFGFNVGGAHTNGGTATQDIEGFSGVNYSLSFDFTHVGWNTAEATIEVIDVNSGQVLATQNLTSNAAGTQAIEIDYTSISNSDITIRFTDTTPAGGQTDVIIDNVSVIASSANNPDLATGNHLIARVNDDIEIDLSVDLVDTDGSETISAMSISGVPAGAALSDGVNTVTSTGADIDIAGWNLSTITLDPTDGYNTDILLTVNATTLEVSGSTSTISSDITVHINNSAPIVSNAISVTTDEDVAFTLTQAQLLANATDADGDAMTATNVALVGSDATILDNGDGTFTITPNVNFNGDIDLTFDITDGANTVATAIDVTVTSINDTPVVTAAIASTTDEDVSITFTQADLLANASDADGEILTAENLVITAGNASIIDNGDGSFTVSPDEHFSGTVDISYDINDGTAPIAASIDLTVDSTLDGQNMFTRVFVDGEELETSTTADFTAATSGVQFDISSDDGQTVGGGHTVNGDENAIYTATSSEGSAHDDTFTFNNLEAGDDFTVDGNGGDDTLDLGMFRADQVRLTMGNNSGTAVIDLDGDGDFTDDADNATVTFSSIENVEFNTATFDGNPHGFETVQTDAEWTLEGEQLSVDSNGSDGQYRIALVDYEGELGSQYTLNTVVNPDATSGQNTNGMIVFDYQDGINFKYVAAWMGGKIWTINTVTNGVHTEQARVADNTLEAGVDNTLTLEVDGDRVELWNDGVEIAAHTYTGQNLSDGEIGVMVNWSDTTFELDMGPSNWAASPGTVEQDIEISEGAVTINLLENAVDAEGETLTVTNISVIGTGDVGDIIDNGDGTITYTPSATGIEAFEFTITDGTNESTGEVRLTVVDNWSVDVLEEETYNLTIDAGLIDTDGSESQTIQITSMPVGLVIADGVNTFTATADIDFIDVTSWDLDAIRITSPTDRDTDYTFDVETTVTDINGDSNTSSRTMTARLTGTNDGPDAGVTVTATTAEDTAITITQAELLANASDIDGDALVASNVQVTNGEGSVFDNGDGTFTVTPNDHSTNNVALSFDISDGTETVASNLNVTVTAVVDAPNLVSRVFVDGEGAPTSATADFSAATSGVEFDISSDNAQTVGGGHLVGGEAAAEYSSNTATGSSHDDTFNFSNLEAGDNFTIDGGAGDDVLNLSEYSGDQVRYDSAAGTVTVDLDGDGDFSDTAESAVINVSNVDRFQFRADEFDGTPHGVTLEQDAQTDWEYDGTRFNIATTDGSGDMKIALVDFEGSMDSTFTLDATVNSASSGAGGDGGTWANGYIIFDYQDANNYKVVGASVGAQAWDIGDVIGGTLTWRSTINDNTMAQNTDNDIQLRVDGDSVELWSEGAMVGGHTWTGQDLSDGEIGVGARNTDATITIDMAPSNWAAAPENINQLVEIDNGAITIDLLENAVDAEGDTLTVTNISLVGAGSAGTVVDNGDGTITYTPTGTGVEAFEYTISDGTNESTGVIRLDVQDNWSVDINEDDSFNLDVSASLVDTDGSETQTVSLTSLPLGLMVSDGVNSFTADALNTSIDITNWQTDSITVTSPSGRDTDYTFDVSSTSTESDGSTSTVTQTMTVNVTPIEPPEVTDSTATGTEDTVYQFSTDDFNITDTDQADGHTITIDAINDGGNGTYYTEATADVILDIVNNEQGLGTEVSASLGSTVVQTNEAGREVLQFDQQAASEIVTLNDPIDLGSEWTIQVDFRDISHGTGAWSTLIDAGTDGGDQHIVVRNSDNQLGVYQDGVGFVGTGYIVDTLTDAQWYQLTAVGEGGTTTFYIDGNEVGTANYQPVQDIQHIGNFSSGNEPFSEAISDFKVFHEALEPAPSTDLPFGVKALQVGDSISVANADALYFVGNDDANGSLASFDYHATDSTGLVSEGATLTMDLAAVNDGPMITALADETVAEDNSITLTQADLLMGASDVDGDTLTASNLTANDATVVDNLDATFTVTPNANYNGTLTVNFDVSDGTATVANTLDINVTAVNDAPEAVNLNYAGTEDQLTIISEAELITNATDAEGDAISVDGVSYSGSDGTLTDTGTIELGNNTNNRIELDERLDGYDAFTFQIEYTSTGSHSGGMDNIFSAPHSGANNNHFNVFVESDGDLGMNFFGSSITFTNSPDLHDGNTHNITISWDSASGQMLVFDNGVVFDNKTVSQGSTMSTGGYAIIGQEQDSYGGSFDSTQSTTNTSFGHVTMAYEKVTKSDIETGADLKDLSSDLAFDIRVESDAIVDTSDNAISLTTAGDISHIRHFEFDANENFNGDVDLDVTYSDGIDTNVETATLTIAPVSDGPVATAVADQLINSNESITFTEAELLANVSDVDGDTLTVDSVTYAGANGTLVDNGNSTWTFTPSAEHNGIEDLTVVVTDGTATTEYVQQVDVNAVVVAHDDGRDPNGQLSIMTSNNSAGITLSASHEVNSSYEAWKALDGVDSHSINNSNSWAANWNNGSGNFPDAADADDPAWFQFEVDTATTLYQYDMKAITNNTYGREPKDWTLQVSDDGVNWTTVNTQTDIDDWNANEVKTFQLDEPATGTYFRIEITANNGDNYVGFDGFQFYTMETIDESVDDHTFDVLANDENVDDDVLSITNLTEVTDADGNVLGTVEVVQVGGIDQVKFTPNGAVAAGDKVAVSFDYTVSDGRSESSNTVNFYVSGTYDAITASTEDDITAIENSALTLTLDELTQHINNPEETTLTLSNLSATDGTFTDNGDSTFTYTPTPEFNGTAQLSYDVSDGTTTLSSSHNLSVLNEVLGTALDDTLNDNDEFDGDAIYGLAGDDILDGGAGDDHLFGGEGSDTLTGGVGADTFVFNLGDENTGADQPTDIITDFEVGTDKIDLTDLLPEDSLNSGNSASDFIDLSENEDGDAVISIHTGGDGAEVDQVIVLDGTSVDDLYGGDTSGVSEADIIQKMIDDQNLQGGDGT
jgi:hypothetical protein